jgi:delta24-sterol reductase
MFYAIPWSYGSLGFLVCAEIKIVPAKDFVHLTYISFKSKQAFLQRFIDESNRPFDKAYDFIEGLMYSEQEGVLMLGNFFDTIPEGKTKNAINNFWKPWFYEHVRSFLNKGQPEEEWIPLRHYYHRHTRSFFWEMEQIIPFGNQPWFRYLLGWMSPPDISLLKLTETDAIHELYDAHHMDQDFLIPISTLDQSLTFFHQEVNYYPLWLCPMKVFETPIRGMVNPTKNEQMFVDVGIYGEPDVENYQAKITTRKLEQYVVQAGGFQALYADTYQTREELRQMFDHTLLDKLRKENNALNAFPEPFDKVSRAART